MATILGKSLYFVENCLSRIGFKDSKSSGGGDRGVTSKLKVRVGFSAIALEKKSTLLHKPAQTN